MSAAEKRAEPMNVIRRFAEGLWRSRKVDCGPQSHLPSLAHKCATEKMSDFERDYPWGGIENSSPKVGEPLPQPSPPPISPDLLVAVHSMLVRAEAGYFDGRWGCDLPSLVNELKHIEKLVENQPEPSPPPTPRNIKCECGMTYAPRCPECGKFNIPEPSPPSAAPLDSAIREILDLLAYPEADANWPELRRILSRVAPQPAPAGRGNADDLFSQMEEMLMTDGYTADSVVMQTLYRLKDAVSQLRR